MLCKCLPLCLSLVQCWPPPQMGMFFFPFTFTWTKLYFISIWSNLVLCSYPSQKVIYCQAGKYCSSHPRKALFLEMKPISSYWATACWDKQDLWSISNQILGEVNIFSAAGFQVKEVCPPLLYKAAQQLFRGPHSLDGQAFGRCTVPNR